MFSFFRKIRINLQNEGKTSRYFKYAIGEIILVVIGILLALQINNWNESRKKNNRELEIIAGLYSEMKQNLISTKTKKDFVVKRLDAIVTLLNMNKETLEFLTDEQLSLIIYGSVLQGIYSPLNSKLNRFLNSEGFEIRSSKKLVNLLYEYSSSIHGLVLQNEGIGDTFTNVQVPFLSKYISIKNLLNQRNPDVISKSKNIVDIKSFINTLEFENLYSALYATASKNIEQFDENINIMEQIIQYIDVNFPKVVQPQISK